MLSCNKIAEFAKVNSLCCDVQKVRKLAASTVYTEKPTTAETKVNFDEIIEDMNESITILKNILK